jgi:hypothetical protein
MQRRRAPSGATQDPRVARPREGGLGLRSALLEEESRGKDREIARLLAAEPPQPLPPPPPAHPWPLRPAGVLEAQRQDRGQWLHG